jgi:LEA14-like dessication related protein
MVSSFLRAGFLVLAAACLAGCASLGSNLVAPTVSVLNVQMLSTDMFAQKFKVRVKVENPNDIQLKVNGIEFEILLMGDGFAEGNSSDQFLLPAKGEAEFDMAVSTNFVSSLGRLISRKGGGKLENIDYEIVGTLYIEKGFAKKVPFNHKGTVDFTKATRRD